MTKHRYSLRDSPFYKLKSKSKLATILHVSQKSLRGLAKLESGYFHFQKPKKNGELRDISAPIPPLKAAQARIAILLRRIVPPEYLFAPVQGRSYVDNAAVHIGAQSVRLLDIKDFFPSCTFKKVFWLFHKRLECSPDVAFILSKITTERGVLPQGSPCSPILAFFAYVDMWEEIATLAKSSACTLSVYADDLTISGDIVPEKLIWEIKLSLFRHGHRYAVQKERAKHIKPVEITGVILTKNGLSVPNRQRDKLLKLRSQLLETKSPNEIQKLHNQLKGRLAQIGQVKSGNTSVTPAS